MCVTNTRSETISQEALLQQRREIDACSALPGWQGGEESIDSLLSGLPSKVVGFIIKKFRKIFLKVCACYELNMSLQNSFIRLKSKPSP